MSFRIISILVKFSALSSMAMTVLPLINLPFTSFKFKPVLKDRCKKVAASCLLLDFLGSFCIR